MAHLKQSSFSYACWLLSKKEYSKKELSKKLASKEYSLSEINETIDRLSTLNYLNDARFSEIFARSRKHKSNRAIFYELKQKGITADQASCAIEELEDEENRAYSLICKMGSLDKEKIIKRLLYRGFSYDCISKAMKKHSESIDSQ